MSRVITRPRCITRAPVNRSPCHLQASPIVCVQLASIYSGGSPRYSPRWWLINPMYVSCFRLSTCNVTTKHIHYSDVTWVVSNYVIVHQLAQASIPKETLNLRIIGPFERESTCNRLLQRMRSTSWRHHEWNPCNLVIRSRKTDENR